MDGPTAMQWITPIVCAIFMSCFAGVALARPELRSARLYAISYLFAMVATASELYFPQTSVWTAGRLIGELCYVACTVLVVAGASLEWKGSLHRGWLSLAATISALPIYFYWFIEVDLVARVIANATTNGGMMVIAGALIWRHVRTHSQRQVDLALGRALAVQKGALGLAVFANSATLGMREALHETMYGQSAYLDILSLVCAVGSLTIGVTLLLHYGARVQRATQEMADRDGLSDLLNRRAFERAAVGIERALRAHRRRPRPLQAGQRYVRAPDGRCRHQAFRTHPA